MSATLCGHVDLMIWADTGKSVHPSACTLLAGHSGAHWYDDPRAHAAALAAHVDAAGQERGKMSATTTTYPKITMPAREAARLGTIIGEALTFTAGPERPILHGVLFDGGPAHTLRLVACDSYMLAAFYTDIVATNAPNHLIAGTELAAIAKALRGLTRGGDEVTLTFGDRMLVVACGSAWTMTAPVEPGDYPNWQALLPMADDAGDGGTPALHAGRLGTFAKLTLGGEKPSKRNPSGGLTLKLTAHGALKPVEIAGAADGCELVGLLMPVRTGGAK